MTSVNVDLEEDSEDLTDSEVEGATSTETPDAFAAAVGDFSTGESVSYELRRRKPFYYCRARLKAQEMTDKVLVLRLDWLRKD